MPHRIKLGLSLLVVVVALIAAWFEHGRGNAPAQYAVLFLGAVMVVAMWLFPEVSRRDGA